MRAAAILLGAVSTVATASDTQYQYDPLGRLTGVIDAQGAAAVYQYDARGNLTAVERHASNALKVTAFVPRSGPVGAQVMVSGVGFSTHASTLVVEFSGVVAPILASAGNRLTVRVPVGAADGPITVRAGGLSDTSEEQFLVRAEPAAPTITGFAPTVALPGSLLQISGTNFIPNHLLTRVLVAGAPLPIDAITTSSINLRIPAAAGSGPLQAITPYGTATSASPLIVPRVPYAGAEVDQLSRGGIDDPFTLQVDNSGHVAIHSFLADTAATVRIRIDGADGDNGTLELYGPTGSRIADLSATPGQSLVRRLSPAGGYSLVYDPGSDQTGTLTATMASAEDHLVPLALGGSPHDVLIATPGNVARLVFEGRRGQLVSFDPSEPDPDSGLDSYTDYQVELYAPDGARLHKGFERFLDPVELPDPGTYTVILDPSGGLTGALRLRAWDVPPPAGGALVLDGTPADAAIAVPGQIARFTFEGTVGQLVSLDPSEPDRDSNLDSYLDYQLGLYAPDGARLHKGFERFLDPVELPDPGTYTVILDPRDDLTGPLTGPLRLQAWDVPPPAGGALVLDGTPADAAITVPGQIARFTFVGVSGQSVSFDASEPDPDAGLNHFTEYVLDVLNPDGSRLHRAFNGGSLVDSLALSQSGTYTVILDPDGGLTGPLRLQAWDETP